MKDSDFYTKTTVTNYFWATFGFLGIFLFQHLVILLVWINKNSREEQVF